MENHKYFYLKLKDNFFDTPAVRLLMSMPQGGNNVLLLLRLYLMTLKTGGDLRMENGALYSVEEIAALMLTQPKRIAAALESLEKVKLAVHEESGLWRLPELKNMVGQVTRETEKMQKSRMKDLF